MKRVVQPEQLDELAANHPLAIGSRKDLRRLNTIMGTVRILANAFTQDSGFHSTNSARLKILEIGCGDGSWHLQFAKRCARFGILADSSLLDLQSIVPAETIRDLKELNWSATVLQSDVFEHLTNAKTSYDAIITNLFLHHFESLKLKELLVLISQRTRFFAACEPRRSPLSLMTANNLWAIGCNSVTRNDAAISVWAGFNHRELSELWPDNPRWTLKEKSAGLFNHGFTATANG